MAPLPANMTETLSSSDIIIHQLSQPDLSLVTGRVMGARYTPIYVLMIILFLLYPIFTLLAYRGTLKSWSLDKYVAARKAARTVTDDKVDDLERHPSYIDLEAVFGATMPSGPPIQRLEVTEDLAPGDH